MNYKILFYLFFFVLFQKIIFANEINIDASKMKVLDEGNIINATNVKANIPDKKIEIEGDKSIYDKRNKLLTIINNVKFFDRTENIYIEAEKAIYNQITDLVRTFGKTYIEVEDKYEIYSEDLFYDRKSQKIYSSKETTIKDSKKNVFNLEDNFVFDIKDEILTSDKTNIMDNSNNEYNFEKAKINLKTNEIVGKELEVNFIDSYFGNPDNQPILKGKASTSNDNKTKIYKAVFTTCNIENKECPGWEIQTEEFVHDRKKKVFEYNNSWLKVFGKKVFYFPFFSHPDPTVKRKTGFLNPVYGSSSENGSWINIPYFKVINEEKDLTFNPRIYFDDKIILQSEYRQAFENSDLITDFSFNNDGKNTNTHLFAKIDGELDSKTTYSFKFEDVSNDEYLKIHNLSASSPIIQDESLLTTYFNIEKKIDENTNLDTRLTVHEDLSKKDSDRFQYILPQFNYTKNILIPESYNGSFKFNSNGHQMNYETNKYESMLINDFLFNSNSFVSDFGLSNSYDFLIKNFNSYTENSTSYPEKDDYDVFGSLLFKSTLPLKKINMNSQEYLSPIMSLRYSPNGTKNISGNDIRLGYHNIFSLNRIGTNEFVEGGRSAALGLEYEKTNLEEESIYGFSIANSFRDQKNENLPKKSRLGETRTDFVGNLFYTPNEIFKFNYEFSYDKNFDGSNYDSVRAVVNLKNFSTNFNFLSTDGIIGDSEVISNTTTYNFDSENSLQFRTTKDLKADFTEYYNLIYSYETDCLTASIEYNKKFYNDKNLVPEQSFLFYIRFIPFTEVRPSAYIINQGGRTD